MEKQNFIQTFGTELANYVENNDKMLGSEGLEVGDTFTITGINRAVQSDEFEDDGKMVTREWISMDCTGDVTSMSVAKLVGTRKRVKYFDKNESAKKSDDFDSVELLSLPHRLSEAMEAIEEQCVGKTYRVVAMAEHCGRYDQTFYLFTEA